MNEEISPAIKAVANAMCAIEARRASTLEEVARRSELWMRYVYEAERLLDEITDYGFAVVNISTSLEDRKQY